MTSSILPPRSAFAPCSPSTQAMASTTLDLPEPFGPTTQVMPGSSFRRRRGGEGLEALHRQALEMHETPDFSGRVSDGQDILASIIPHRSVRSVRHCAPRTPYAQFDTACRMHDLTLCSVYTKTRPMPCVSNNKIWRGVATPTGHPLQSTLDSIERRSPQGVGAALRHTDRRHTTDAGRMSCPAGHPAGRSITPSPAQRAESAGPTRRLRPRGDRSPREAA